MPKDVHDIDDVCCKIWVLVNDLEPEAQAAIAGRLLAKSDIATSTFNAFWAELSDDEQDEMRIQANQPENDPDQRGEAK